MRKKYLYQLFLFVDKYFHMWKYLCFKFQSYVKLCDDKIFISLVLLPKLLLIICNIDMHIASF